MGCNQSPPKIRFYTLTFGEAGGLGGLPYALSPCAKCIVQSQIRNELAAMPCTEMNLFQPNAPTKIRPRHMNAHFDHLTHHMWFICGSYHIFSESPKCKWGCTVYNCTIV